MHVITQIRRMLESDPLSPNSQVFARMVLSLEDDVPFRIGDLYALDYDRFQLAIALLDEWRVARFYGKKFRLMALALAALNEIASVPPSVANSLRGPIPGDLHL